MWKDCQPGACVLLEMPGRWYLGVVSERSQLTVRLTPALCGHDLGDLGLFLAGTPGTGAELTPLPRGLELNLALCESCQPYPEDAFRRINTRTHSPEEVSQ